MKSYDYMVAENIDAAMAEYKEKGRMLKAGGIDLMDSMKERIESPDAVLSIHGLKDLTYIKPQGSGVSIGCLTTLADIGRSELLQKSYPVLAVAAGEAATPQVRERATIGGNLCQRPRCWYYRHKEFDCLKKGGYMCFAVEGENQYHAIFGEGPCHIVHPSNCAPPLAALNAEFVIRAPGGERTVKTSELFAMPENSLYQEHTLKEGEILTEVRIPQAPSQSATIELREKQSFDWPLVIASVARVSGKWNVCLGAVAPIPWISQPAMDVLGDKDITQSLAASAGEAAARGASPMSGNGYKVDLVKVAVKRALLKAAGMEVPE